MVITFLSSTSHRESNPTWMPGTDARYLPQTFMGLTRQFFGVPSTESKFSKHYLTSLPQQSERGAAVDPECTTKVKTAHVFCEGNDIYDATLNLTNVLENNNKFYILQILKDNATQNYSVWFRWGRVGLRGQSMLTSCGDDVEEAKRLFCEKFFAKTLNEWGNRSEFESVPGKYDLVKVNYSNEEEENDEKKGNGKSRLKKSRRTPPSKLDKKLQAVINLICDMQTMDDCLKEMRFDASKLPLGKLTRDQITAGYESLKKIERCIKAAKQSRNALANACNEYYTRIPHCFGMRRPPLITDLDSVKTEIALLEVLSDAEVTVRTIKKMSGSKKNPIDMKYDQMMYSLEAIGHSSNEFGIIEAYLHNTHGPTHVFFKLKLIDLFKCHRKNGKENENDGFYDINNQTSLLPVYRFSMLLWHGSRLVNWYSILCSGLKIAPPEAPSTGYMFGKGIYFADISSKAANYCMTTEQKNVGLVLLCEVALGKQAELTEADCQAAEHLGKCNSVKGVGKLTPDPSENYKLPDGCVIPLGHPVPNRLTQETCLQYNEYIVYDLSQIRLRYLAKLKFTYEC
ncbi:unnamed protein product [Soboliphyme baturini]|uniref:Poly [ADP-ribose] polymerase n=1 Tax=Soboliphyme baturini TaxID=241478 RepID=A0A183II69_9BILA|nr:unnamed protein product [Soboliphyme baturini]